MDLSDALKVGYKNSEEQQKYFNDNNYIRDTQLSTPDYQAYFNKDENKLIFNVTGSHKVSDIFTDVNLAVGNIKNTDRYKKADRALKAAKLKYSPEKSEIIGHSLGATIGGLIASKEDEVKTLDKGFTIGTRVRGNETSYRTAGDVVSLLGVGTKRLKTLKNPNQNYFKYGLLGNAFKAHDISNIKNKGIFV
jgi:hypothetical protein